MVVGNSLFADMGGGEEDGKTLLYQTSEHHPIISYNQGVDPLMRYAVSLTHQNSTVAWEINGNRLTPGRLQSPISYPARVGFGAPDSYTKYDNITVTGVLAASGPE
jgi:hypothetical protein